jgi:hypothetical protein
MVRGLLARAPVPDAEFPPVSCTLSARAPGVLRLALSSSCACTAVAAALRLLMLVCGDRDKNGQGRLVWPRMLGLSPAHLSIDCFSHNSLAFSPPLQLAPTAASCTSGTVPSITCTFAWPSCRYYYVRRLTSGPMGRVVRMGHPRFGVGAACQSHPTSMLSLPAQSTFPRAPLACSTTSPLATDVFS